MASDSALTPLGGNPADDEVRAQRLARMKRTATGMLAGCAVIFVVARLLEPRWPLLAYVRATAEAAMVGGFADWFAVTALFRHPLGVRIPHTAIIPARKDRIGRTLGRFVENNFMSRAVIESRVAGMQLGERVARWLIVPKNTHRIAQHVGAAIVAASHVLSDDEVSDMIERGIAARLRSVQVAPLVGNILAILTADRRHQELLDEALRIAARAADQNDAIIRARIAQESPWWVPELVNDKIHEKIVGGIERTLAEIADDAYHPLRTRFDEALDAFIERLRTSPETIERAEAIKEDVLSHPALREFADSLWRDGKEALMRHAEQPESAEPTAVQRGLANLAQAVLDDPTLLEKVDRWIVDALGYVVEEYRHEVAQLIEHTVEQWDADATSQKIELQIGSDLQFIRINGTLVGALVGFILYSITQWF